MGMPTVASIKRDHPGAWLAIEVHRRSASGAPLTGRLLYHGPSEAAACSHIGRTRRSVYIVRNVPLKPSLHAGLL